MTPRGYLRWANQSPAEVIAKREVRKRSSFQKLRQYIEMHDRGENHFKRIGISMMAQCMVIMPLVGSIIMQTGNHIVFWIFAAAGFVAKLNDSTTNGILKAIRENNISLAVMGTEGQSKLKEMIIGR